MAVNDVDPAVRFLSALRSDFTLTQERLNQGLADVNAAIRRLYVAKGSHLLTASQIDTLLTDPAPNVRQELLNVKGNSLSSAQFDQALRDPKIEIRLTALKLSNCRLNEMQFIKGLESDHPSEIKAMLDHLTIELVPFVLTHSSALARSAGYSYLPFKLTSEQIMSGLKDPDECVQLAVINRPDFSLSPKQFVSIVETSSPLVIDAASIKANSACIEEALNLCTSSVCTRIISQSTSITIEQINRCLSDQRSEIALAALKKTGRNITKEQVTTCLNSTNENVRYLAISLFGVDRLDKSQLSVCLSDQNEKIRLLAISSRTVVLSDKNIDQALSDKSINIRAAAVSRPGFLPTPLQFTRGIKDKSKKVREIFLSRFNCIDGKITNLQIKKNFEPNVELNTILLEIIKNEAWTSKKHLLKEQLYTALQNLGYVHFSVNARNALIHHFGEDTIYDVPLNKRGPLQSMRGKRIHLVCLGHGPYSTISFAYKAS